MENIVKLSSLKSGEVSVISKIEGLELLTHKRFIELGFVKNAKIEIIKMSSNAMIVGIRGFCLSIDNLVADCIFVQGA